MTKPGLPAKGILAAVSLIGIACAGRESSVTAPSAGVARTYVFALHGKAGQSIAVRPFVVGPDGRLTASAAGDVFLPVRSQPLGPFVDAARRLAYFVDVEGGLLLASRIDPASGAMSLFGAFTLGQRPGSAALDPSGRFLYTAASGSVFGYRIDTDGGLSVQPLPGSPFTTPSDHGYPIVTGVTFSSSGRFLWAHAEQSPGSFGYPRRTRETLLSFRIVPDSGVLEPTGQLEIKVWDGDRSNLAVDPQERFAFLASRERIGEMPGVTAYGIDPQGGALAEGERLRVFAERLFATASGRWLLADDGWDLHTLEIQTQGDLVLRNSLSLKESARGIVQHGPYVYLGSDWRTSEAIVLGARLVTVRLDETSGTLAIVEDLRLPDANILALALANLTGD